MTQITEMAKSLEPELIKFLREIIAIPSFCGKEGAVIERMKLEMEKIGYDEIRVDGLGNLLGRIGSGPRILAIDGHCDTVAVGNSANWDRDPFGADLVDGRIFGRGACDQKGGLACAIYTGKVLKNCLPENVTLWVVASIMEEDCEGLPWKYIIEEEKLVPDAVLLTEPTNLIINRGQRGRLEFKIKTTGVSCHGSAPERGVNAIYKMTRIVKDIEQLNLKLQPDQFLGKGSVTATEIRSTSPSLCAVPDSCTIHLDRRLSTGETIDTSKKEIEAFSSFINGEAEIWVPEYRVPSYNGKLYPMKSYFPTWVLDPNHQLINTAKKSYQNLFNQQPEVDKWVFSTNGVATMGLYNIPTIGFGPGEERFAHSPNEQIPVDHLIKALAFYGEFVINFGNQE